MIKCISIGAVPHKFPELAAFESSHFQVAWTPVIPQHQSKHRMAYVLVGSNDPDAGNSSPYFEADLINYTGKLEDPRFDVTYWFKNGYLHNDDGPAHIYRDKQQFAKNGLFEGESGEGWALGVLKQFYKGE